jgi:hypothetical protein
LELHGFEAVLPTLLHRKWVLYIADTGAGTFVSGDHPVTLTWTDPELQKGPYPPGHGMRSTELVFPLTSQLALIGTFEGKRKEVRASRRVVSAINSRVVMFLERHIYAPHRSFEFFGRDGSILPSKKLFSQFAGHT